VISRTIAGVAGKDGACRQAAYDWLAPGESFLHKSTKKSHMAADLENICSRIFMLSAYM
jgi:hypothetical protein